MSTTTIIAELLVIGLLALMTVLFSILSIFKISNFSFLIYTKDFAAIIAILITILAYLFGSLHNHLSYSILPFLAGLSQFILNLKFLRFLFRNKSINVLIKMRKTWVDRDDEVQRMKLFIFENGSISLIERIKYMRSLSTLFGSTSTIIPFFAASLASWLVRSFDNWKAASAVIVVCFLIFFLTAIASFTVNTDYRQELKAANEVILARISSTR
jgi:hypothetical protein